MTGSAPAVPRPAPDQFAARWGARGFLAELDGPVHWVEFGSGPGTDGPPIVFVHGLGGIFAREIARLYPGQVRRVITLGSPFAQGNRWGSHAEGPYQRLRHLHAGAGRIPSRLQVARPIRVPSTAVYSRQDGIVSWQACIEPETALHQNVEVRCSHLGFGVDPATLWLIADRLALPPGQHRRFRPPPLMRPLYPGR